MSDFEKKQQSLIFAGQSLYAKGMVPATSGNFSAKMGDGNISITVSGAHKGRLVESDIMQIDIDGNSLDGKKPSAETLLHTQIYQQRSNIGVVLHPHSVNSTVLSHVMKSDEQTLVLQNYELLKAFPGIDSHECRVEVPVLDNDQNIQRLAANLTPYFQSNPMMIGYLIRGHGFYTWGETMDDALRHVEAFEFLFECELQLRRLGH